MCLCMCICSHVYRYTWKPKVGVENLLDSSLPYSVRQDLHLTQSSQSSWPACSRNLLSLFFWALELQLGCHAYLMFVGKWSLNLHSKHFILWAFSLATPEVFFLKIIIIMIFKTQTFSENSFLVLFHPDKV